MILEDKFHVLKQYFGHSEFRGGQEAVIDCILSGRDCLCVMPTGAGKSVCYQVPSLMLDGIAVVISPLISLMKDQVNALNQNGIPSAYINSSLTLSEYNKAVRDMVNGKYKLVYVAPERLESRDFLMALSSVKISLIAVDEAHCVSQWGQDFRPSYMKIKDFALSLTHRPVIAAFTATATERVREDIEIYLGLSSPFCMTTGFDRPNLFFGVIDAKDKMSELINLLSNRREKSGIIYCLTRALVEQVCEKLQSLGYSAVRYHAGLSDEERRANQDDFLYDRAAIMVATNAFGMGIDKSNVSYVIHYNMPKDIESYYQEAGRAGRDGSAADCILLYSSGDVHTNKFLIERSEQRTELSREEMANIRERDLERLKQMTFYSTSAGCLRRSILKYFGEQAGANCGNCSGCLGAYELVDATTHAQMVLSLVVRTGEHYGAKMICDVLRGSRNENILLYSLDEQSTYGLLRGETEDYVRGLITSLTVSGYLQTSDGKYPVLKVTDRGWSILKGNEKFEIKKPKKKVENTSKSKLLEQKYGRIDDELFAKLKNLRYKLAEIAGVPAFVIFSDSTLTDMCRLKPRTIEEFMSVSGVGEAKCEKYGRKFVREITKHLEQR